LPYDRIDNTGEFLTFGPMASRERMGFISALVTLELPVGMRCRIRYRRDFRPASHR
jgi:hypothetical protein